MNLHKYYIEFGYHNWEKQINRNLRAVLTKDH